MSEQWERRLQAFHDGELSRLGRLRMERRLRRDPEARQQLARLSEIGGLVREHEAAGEAPDLWHAIRAELRPAAATAAPPEPAPERVPWLRWAAPSLAAAAAAAAIVVTLYGGDDPAAASLRWLDSGGRSAMVLQDDREATIIWLLEGGGRDGGASSSTGGTHRALI